MTETERNLLIAVAEAVARLDPDAVAVIRALQAARSVAIIQGTQYDLWQRTANHPAPLA